MPSSILGARTTTSARCDECAAWFFLSEHQVRRGHAKRFCSPACRRRYHNTTYKHQHPHRKTHGGPRPRPEEATATIGAADQAVYGGGFTDVLPLPAYPPYRCTCQPGMEECSACRAWRGATPAAPRLSKLDTQAPAIVAAYRQGESIHVLALTYGVRWKTIQRILHLHEGETHAVTDHQ